MSRFASTEWQEVAAGDEFVSVVPFEHRYESDTDASDDVADGAVVAAGDDSSESGAGAMAKA